MQAAGQHRVCAGRWLGGGGAAGNGAGRVADDIASIVLGIGRHGEPPALLRVGRGGSGGATEREREWVGGGGNEHARAYARVSPR